jgi:predicted Zn finger-like uncharacterized protein
MIVICEDCGKKYRIDPAKLKAQTVKFKCKSCSHIIVVSKPEVPPQKPLPPPFVEPDAEMPPPVPPAAAERPTGKYKFKRPRARIPKELTKVSLRSKMLVLFFVLPIALFATSAFLFLDRMSSMAAQLTKDSTQIISQMAESKLADISRAVATQCQLYLLSRPDLRKEDFNSDLNFRRLAVQRVGLTGYTALYELPDSDNVWRTWAHVNPNIIGIDMQNTRKALGKSFDRFWKIYIGVREGGESRGYYSWRDKDGRIRDKFMVCTPVEGTRYIIAATTYLDELTQPVNRLEQRSETITQKTRSDLYIIFGITLLVVGGIVFFYGYRLTGKIKSLTKIADRISIGELEADINVRSKDEIGELAEAIGRMQDSIRLSIERLRRRR